MWSWLSILVMLIVSSGISSPAAFALSNHLTARGMSTSVPRPFIYMYPIYISVQSQRINEQLLPGTGSRGISRKRVVTVKRKLQNRNSVFPETIINGNASLSWRGNYGTESCFPRTIITGNVSLPWRRNYGTEISFSQKQSLPETCRYREEETTELKFRFPENTN